MCWHVMTLRNACGTRPLVVCTPRQVREQLRGELRRWHEHRSRAVLLATGRQWPGRAGGGAGSGAGAAAWRWMLEVHVPTWMDDDDDDGDMAGLFS